MEAVKLNISPKNAAETSERDSSCPVPAAEVKTGTTPFREEGQVLLRHLRGDRGAFGELVEIYRAPIYSYLVRCGVGHDDRDDLFQDIFIKIHRAASTFDSSRPLHPWLFTIVCNTVRNHLRRQRVRQLVFAEQSAPEKAVELPDFAPDGERRAVARQTVQTLEKEIQQLPLAQREVVVLAAVEKRPLKEVALLLGLNINTVKTHLRRGRLALARALVLHNHLREEEA